MSFSFSPKPTEVVHTCIDCIHRCPFDDNNIYCTVKDRKISFNEKSCNAHRLYDAEQKRIVVINIYSINKFITSATKNIYCYNGIYAISRDTTDNDFELYKSILEDKPQIDEYLKKNLGVKNPMYKFIFFAEKINDIWKPIYENMDDLNIDEVREQLKQLYEQYK